MKKEFNSLEELKPYYNKETNTYVFKKNGVLLDIELNFDLCVCASITAGNITAWGINALNIHACDITAGNITAWDIDALNIHACDITARNIVAWNIDACDIFFYAFCILYRDIKCNSIKGRRENHIMKALDGEIIIKGESK